MLVSFISLIGIIGLREFNLKKVIFMLVAFSSGTLFGTAFLHLIPEALELTGDKALVFIPMGIGIFLSWKSS
ncbi:MAG: hypothetical protein DDT42_00586 [candidate division WS2 bacterium]|uniref:ZIP family metal transporter n=1 Tax=Psychracetigena formicireducens TaxID=2986056 RepID=A0A9E2BFN1_PSYF1|nr:hypothetical protein [Candidatus Psychracetigena formicireducens]MBT9144738.1 hypothetical protein [Candidatus Psychracetigena formicireducens]